MAPLLSLSESFYGVADALIRKRAATEQGGLLSGVDPTAVNVNDPLRLWIIQLAVIMCTAQLLSLLLKKLKQPRVIAEVIGGIFLGPTVMGRIPGFTEHIFPTDSLPFLSLVANIGLVLFLFLVGLELEISSIKRNARTSLIISMGGMILPFSIGAGMSKLIYKNYVLPVDPGTPFTHFMLFTCVAYSITAFPVLCRILTELKLLDTTVGICALSAGVGNDIVGWTLLALSVALVNATSGLSALYIVLVAIGWALIVIIPCRKMFYYLALKTDSLTHSEPSIMFMTVTLIFVFASAFFTDVIGVHAIFGGFLAGLVVPRENGLAIKMTEKIEDLVGIVFLPLYFTISGLSTNLGLLNTGTIWAYTIAIIVTAWFGKFVGATSGARFCGFGWRESAAVGELMSCKGLVELIVLNVGLQARILSVLVFSMFVLEALTLTFITTPAVVVLYPPHLRRRIAKHPIGTSKTLDGDGAAPGEKKHYPGPGMTVENLGLDGERQKKDNMWGSVTVILDRLEHLPGLICVSELLRKSNSVTSADIGRSSGGTAAINSQTENTGEGSSKETSPLAMVNALPATGDLTRTNTGKDSEDITPTTGFSRGLSSQTIRTKGPLLNALRLMELSDRTSAVMKSILDSSSLLHADPLVNIFKTIHELRGGHVRGMIKVEPVEQWANVVEETVEEVRNENEERELVVACWLGDITSKPASGNEDGQGDATAPSATLNPFDFFFNRGQQQPPPLSHSKSTATVQQLVPASRETTTHAHFVRSLFAKSAADVGLYVDNTSHTDASSSSSIGMGGHNTILFPFFGGPDDRAALDMVVGFCRDSRIRGVIVRIIKGERGSEESEGGIEKPAPAYAPGVMGTISSAYEGTVGTTHGVSAFPDTIYAAHTTATRLQSRTADEMSWEKYTSQSSPDLAPCNVEMTTLRSPSPLEAFNNIARTVYSQNTESGSGRMLIVVGRSRRLAVESHHAELTTMVKGGGHHLSGEFRKTVGDVASAIVIGGVRADMFVLQAGHGSPSAGVEV